MLVKNLATNTGTETKQSQISWWTALSTSGNSQHCTTSCTISFRDLWATAEKEFELHHRINLAKSVSKCQGNCGRPTKVEEVVVVRSYGRVAWTDKSTGEEKARFGPMYIHLHENCLKNFSETFYAPSQSFDFSTKKITQRHKKSLRKKTKHCCCHWELSKVSKKYTRWSSIFSEFRLMTAFFTTSHIPVCRVVLKFVDSYR